MADELLNAVIQLEAEIQQQLEIERSRAAAWLAGVRAELEERQKRAAEKRETVSRQALEEARKRAEEQQAALIAEEMHYCRSLEEIADETLAEVLRRELGKVLPGQSDDHRDGES